MDKRQALIEKVRDTIMNTMGGEKEDYRSDASLANDLGVDSLDAVEIIMNIEKEFNISISDQEAETLDSIDAIVDYLESKNIRP